MEDRTQTRWMIRVMVVSLILLPMCLAACLFAGLARRFGLSDSMAHALTAALLFGTHIAGFSPHINNHVPAIACLCVVLYASIGLLNGHLQRRPLWLSVYGFAGALVFTLDMPATVYVALAGAPLLFRYRLEAVLWGGAGMALPLLGHFSAMLISSGSLLAIQMRPELYFYEASYWRNPGGIDALNEPKGWYLFHMTFGRYGTFLLFPVLLFGLASAARECWKPTRLRAYVLTGLAGFVLLTTYYVLKTNNYGGAAYGFRWHMASAPVLLLMAVPLFQSLGLRRLAPLFLAAFAVSTFSAYECWKSPWETDHEWTARHVYGPAVITERPAE